MELCPRAVENEAHCRAPLLQFLKGLRVCQRTGTKDRVDLFRRGKEVSDGRKSLPGHVGRTEPELPVAAVGKLVQVAQVADKPYLCLINRKWVFAKFGAEGYRPITRARNSPRLARP